MPDNTVGCDLVAFDVTGTTLSVATEVPVALQYALSTVDLGISDVQVRSVRGVSLTEAYTSDEMFCSGTMGELVAVTTLDGRTIVRTSCGVSTPRLGHGTRSSSFRYALTPRCCSFTQPPSITANIRRGVFNILQPVGSKMRHAVRE